MVNPDSKCGFKRFNKLIEQKGRRRSYIWTVTSNDMGKIGYAPKWGPLHTKTYEEFASRSGDQEEHSPKFKDIDKAMKWLHEDP